MLIDCEGCSVRGSACGGCVITLLLDTPPAVHQLGEAEAQAIEVFALAGFEVSVLEPTHVDPAFRERRRPAGRRSRRGHAA
jgi:hypothetical protein